MKNLIELEDVNLIRNGKALLKEINWQVKENEYWAILGLNGSLAPLFQKDCQSIF